MIIFVKLLTRKTIELSVKSNDTILSIKDKIFDKTNVPQFLQILIFAGRVLKEKSLFSDNSLAKESTIHMVPCLGYLFNNKIQIVTKDRLVEIKVRVFSCNLIEDIKFQIQDETGIPWESLHIYSEDKELMDHDSLIDLVSSIFLILIKKIINILLI